MPRETQRLNLAHSWPETPRKGRPAALVSPLPAAHSAQREGGSGAAAQGVGRDQSACLRRKAGISRSSMPPDDSASTRAAACVRLVRHTLGTDMLP